VVTPLTLCLLPTLLQGVYLLCRLGSLKAQLHSCSCSCTYQLATDLLLVLLGQLGMCQVVWTFTQLW
jgi:hypothetical protein